MPTYLDFDSTKRFRDFILGKTLSQPNGPQTFTPGNYSVQNLSDRANIDSGDVDDNRTQMLQIPQTNNVFKPLEFSVTENVNTLPRRANLSLYPYFELGNHNLISVFNQQNLNTESELMKFAGKYLVSNNGPIYSRIAQNIKRETDGRLRIIDALNGNIATATNIVTGREPLVAPDYSITVAKTLPGKAIDFIQVAAGVEFPFSEIPGDYLTNPRNPINVRPVPKTQLGKFIQDATGVLGSLIGIQRRPAISRKPSDLLIEHMGQGQKSTLYDLLTYSKYAPNYTTSARSQNTSKVFNFIDNVAQGVKNLLGVDAPRGGAYIGDDRGNDVKYAMNDFNDRPVRSNYYLSLMFDPVQAQLFQRKRNYSDNGSITGKLTWISRNSKNELGVNNKEWGNQQSDFDDSQSTSFQFREDSILGYTQEILDSMPSNGGEARSHIANVIDQTSRLFREGDVMLSRGSAIKYVDKFGEESGAEFCRVWTKDRSYLNYTDTMRRTQNVRKYDDSILDRPWNLNIAPISNGGKDFNGSTNILPKGDGFYAKKYMFSIENLAWKTSNLPGFTVNDLPYCERGPNGGRIMWFPPYDLKVSEQNSARWESNTFLGRPEPIYTYQNTERSGQISFKVVVDHPSVLNLLVREHFKGMGEEETENYINAFFAGCEEIDFYDLIRRYRTISPDDAKTLSDFLNKKIDTNTIQKYRSVTTGDVVKKEPPVLKTPETQKVKLNVSLNFANDWPKITDGDYKGTKYSDLYKEQIGSSSWTGATYNGLTSVMKEILSGTTSYNTANAIHDKKVLFGKDIPTGETQTYITLVTKDLENEIKQAQSGYTEYSTTLTTLKSDLEGGLVKDITIGIFSSCSALADTNYNFKLSIRRSYSILLDILDKIKKEGDSKTILDQKWPKSFTGEKNSKTDQKVEFTLKDLGYAEMDGKITFATISAGEEFTNERNERCSKKEFKFVSGPNSLKYTAPVAFGCRQSSIRLEYSKTPKQEPQKPVDPSADPTVRTRLVPDGEPTTPKSKTPPIDIMKRIIMKTLSECYYFQKIEENDPVVFKTLKEKLKYFHPAFHSTTPEGLNSRLTFLNQCIRPGDTIPVKGLSDASDLNARNTSFGPPPICVLRVGDFYNSKIIIRDVNITFDENTWDLNPEGIGVQPMIANVSLQVNFIGGQGLSKPVERLQNALSSNFYANTEMYDERSIQSEGLRIGGKKAEEFTKEFLEILKNSISTSEESTNNSKGNELTEGEYCGTLNENTLSYDKPLIENIYTQTKQYFSSYESLYNVLVKQYGPSISSMILHPNYRNINTYEYVNGNNSTGTIPLFGEYEKNRSLSFFVNVLKTSMVKTLSNSNICQMMSLNDVLSIPKQNKANELLQPELKKIIESKIGGITDIKTIDGFLKNRNDLINTLDNLNFVVKNEFDIAITADKLSKATLSGFTRNLLYDEYENCINHINNNNSKLYEDLDTSINFNSPTITTNTLSQLLSVLLKDEDKNKILEVFKVDTIIFDENTINKITKKLDSFIGAPIKDKNFKFKKLKERKNNKPIVYTATFDNSFTDDNIKEEVKKLKSKNNVPVKGNKLNYFRP